MAPKPDLLGHEADGPDKKFVSPYVTLQESYFGQWMRMQYYYYKYKQSHNFQ
jgi:hypothetical protein